ncbi:hypothetical protein U9M48_019777 [Paspalum notatum var. saurae]|uniref:CCHC-type domain-containing protein n=1 Tax=Paspalum notatum var. saurae TaxID=547442 RepID=A0AAQ3WR06_PASNO
MRLLMKKKKGKKYISIIIDGTYTKNIVYKEVLERIAYGPEDPPTPQTATSAAPGGGNAHAPNPPPSLRHPHSPSLPRHPLSPASASRPDLASNSNSISNYRTPPPPPISGRPPASGTSWVPETHESELRRTFAEVIRAPAADAFKSTNQPVLTRLESVINVPPRSSYYRQDSLRRATTPTSAPRRAPARREPRIAPASHIPVQPKLGWSEWQGTRLVDARHQTGPLRFKKHSLPGAPPHSRRLQPREPPSPALRAFCAKTEGRCFICLASNHRSISCCDPVCCFRCRRSGHRKRHCRATRPSIVPRDRRQARYVPKLPPPLPRSATAAMSLLGDPAMRLDADECFIPASYAINASRRE